ncbi:MAG: hypothetical protein JJE04_15350 [Acidobacteriia bacterium]|nr:hypothetical protein [Terriglobia bacterium]
MEPLIAADCPVTAVPGGGPRNFSISACPGNKGACLPECQQVARFMREENATVVSQRVFSSGGALCDGARAPENGLELGWPVTRLHGNGARNIGSLNCQLYAVSGSFVKRIEIDGQTAGGVFEDEDVRCCVLGDLRPRDLAAPRPVQAESVLQQMELALRAAEMDLTDIVRTWFFIDRILDWYGGFNVVRNRFFQDRNLFAGVLPASTGVGTANSAGAALIADVLAMKPKRGRLDFRNVASPLQCPAPDYKSSFSRAVEVSIAGRRSLFISGTASIAPDGVTAHVGAVEKQVALTMTVVERILQSRRMSWSDVTRGIAYFKDIDEAPALERYCRDNHIPDLPVVVSSADICRDDLLFEIEVDAASVRGTS